MTRYGILSTYPPTRCGIATFTESLAAAINRDAAQDAVVVRILDEPPTAALGIGAGGPVIDVLVAGDPRSATDAARALNSCDVAIVQHEYGIYGGIDGSDVLRVLAQVAVPCIVVLHTVLDTPTSGQRAVLEQVAARASSIVVMTQAAHDLLATRYAVSMHKVAVIPHGVPEWAPAAPAGAPDAPDTERPPTVVTWGLIGPGKGIEWGIRAMAELDDVHPLPRYRVAGQTHPKVLAQFGDAYRDSLTALVDDLGLADRVTLSDAYLANDDLARFVQAADVVLLPYDSRNQITSGVLVEAIAAGKHVIATGFPHAIELLDESRGTIVPHQDPAAIAAAIRAALTRARRSDVGAPRRDLGTPWPDVADRYRELATRLLRVRAA